MSLCRHRRGGMRLALIDKPAAGGWLTQDPCSPFTNVLAILRHTADGYVALKNDYLTSVTADSVSEQRITSADHLADTFNTIFNLDVPKSGNIWDKIQTIGRDKAT